MDAKAEAKAEADSVRHAEEFCRKHNISEQEWQLAVDSREALVKSLHDNFWKLSA